MPKKIADIMRSPPVRFAAVVCLIGAAALAWSEDNWIVAAILFGLAIIV